MYAAYRNVATETFTAGYAISPPYVAAGGAPKHLGARAAGLFASSIMTPNTWTPTPPAATGGEGGRVLLADLPVSALTPVSITASSGASSAAMGLLEP